MTKEQFSNFMGILASEHNTYLTDRIFASVNHDGDNVVSLSP